MHFGLYDVKTEMEMDSFVTFGGYSQSVIDDSLKLESVKARQEKDAEFKGIDWLPNTDDKLKLW